MTELQIAPPRIRISDLIGGALILLGALVFLGVLHVASISHEGSLEEAYGVFFKVFLTIYASVLLFAFIAGLYLIFHWLTWQINTPDWKKRQYRGGNV